MSDISNKTLAIFLLTATIVSLGGFLLTLNHIDSITGRAASDTGTSNFSINSSISVVFTQNLVEFGVGVVNNSGSGHVCTLNTTGPGMLNGGTNPTGGPDCIGFNASINPLRIQNQGTVNVSLNISFNSSATEFVGGTSPTFGFKASSNETGSCGNASNTYFKTTYQSIAINTNYTICNTTAFDWHSGNRTINIDLGISIPQDVLPGARKVIITAYASNP